MNRLIRASDRYYRKHPNVALSVVLAALFACALYVAARADSDNTAAWSRQAVTTRSST